MTTDLTLSQCKTVASLQKAVSKQEEIEFLSKRILSILDEIKELAPEANTEWHEEFASAISRLGLL